MEIVVAIVALVEVEVSLVELNVFAFVTIVVNQRKVMGISEILAPLQTYALAMK